MYTQVNLHGKQLLIYQHQKLPCPTMLHPVVFHNQVPQVFLIQTSFPLSAKPKCSMYLKHKQIICIRKIKRSQISLTFAAIARKYRARTEPEAVAQCLPLSLTSVLLAAATASSTSSAVAAGISPEAKLNDP